MYICSMYMFKIRGLSIFLFMLMFSLVSFTGAAQAIVKGKVLDSTNTPAPFISVALLNGKDSSLVKGKSVVIRVSMNLKI